MIPENIRLLMTLPIQTQISMYRGEAVGFFQYLIKQEDPFYNLRADLCLGYYTEHAASKKLTSTYKNIINMVEENPSINKTADEIIANMIRGKFINKWNRVYEALVTATYDPLSEYDYNELKTGTNVDTSVYDTRIENVGNVGTKETTTNTANGKNDVYGFNSLTPVGADENSESSTEITIGLAEENTSTNTQDKSGSDEFTHDISESITKSGRDKNSAELLNKELSFRDKYVFFDIVYKDIDSIVCLSIY